MPDFKNGFRGSVNGSVQTAMTDQPGGSLPGMIAFASDLNQQDCFAIGETLGIAAGKGVELIHDAEQDYHSQHPNQRAFLPISTSTAVKFGGILIFDEHCQSDDNGVPGWAKGRIGQVLRPVRAGGRIWVKAKETITLASTVNWVTVAPVSGLYEVGEFAPAALGGGSAGTSVLLPHAVWVVPATAGKNAMIELVGTLTATVPVNSSSV